MRVYRGAFALDNCYFEDVIVSREYQDMRNSRKIEKRLIDETMEAAHEEEGIMFTSGRLNL